jgi:hypothetical protein
MSSSKLIPDCAISSSSNRLTQLKAVARANCKNETSSINFNKYGELDNIGLIPASDYFIDTVILSSRICVSEGDFTLKDYQRLYTDKLRALITQYAHTSREFAIHPFPTSEKDSFIKWRVNCPEIPISNILSLLNSEDLQKVYTIITIDVTRDFSGSFDLTDIIDYFKEQHDMQEGYSEDDLFYEKDLIQKTGIYFIIILILKHLTLKDRLNVYFLFIIIIIIISYYIKLH